VDGWHLSRKVLPWRRAATLHSRADLDPKLRRCSASRRHGRNASVLPKALQLNGMGHQSAGVYAALASTRSALWCGNGPSGLDSWRAQRTSARSSLTRRGQTASMPLSLARRKRAPDNGRRPGLQASSLSSRRGTCSGRKSRRRLEAPDRILTNQFIGAKLFPTFQCWYSYQDDPSEPG
jgi:hypothetical protein